MAFSGIQEAHTQLIHRLNPSANNPFDLANFVYTIACTPAIFFYSHDSWRSFHQEPHSRATVLNVLTLLPTWILVLKVCIQRTISETIVCEKLKWPLTCTAYPDFALRGKPPVSTIQ